MSPMLVDFPPPRLLKTLQCLISPFLDACSCFQMYLCVCIWGTNGTLVEVSIVETLSQIHTDDLLFIYGGNTVWGGSVKACSSSCVAVLAVQLGH